MPVKIHLAVSVVWSLRWREEEVFVDVERAHQPGGPRGLMGGIGTSTASFTCFVGDSFTVKLQRADPGVLNGNEKQVCINERI